MHVNMLRIVAIIPVYNEADILDQLLTHLQQNGVAFVILDGGSEDGSIEIAQKYKGRGLLDHKVVKRYYKRWGLDLEDSLQMAITQSPVGS